MTTLWIQFFNGTLRGRPLVVQGDEIGVGHSDANTIELNTALDPAVAPRHAMFRHGAEGWTIEGFADTFVNGAHCASGQRVAVNQGDWVLFGASGTLARLAAPGAAADDAWIVFESEASPGALIAHPIGARRHLVFEPMPHLADAGGLELIAERAPVMIAGSLSHRAFWVDGQTVERIALRAGMTIRAAANAAGVRVLTVPAATGPGTDTIQKWIATAVRRKSRLPWAVSIAACVLVVGLAVALGAYVLWSQTRFTREMTFQKKSNAEETASMRRQIEEDVTRRLRDREKQETDDRARLEKLLREEMAKAGADPERAKFQKWLEAYRASVFLIYAQAEIAVPKMDPIVIPVYGTGFAVAPDVIVTNKHVVQSWKFDPDIALLLKEFPEAKTTVKLACWPGGASFLTAADEPNYKEGYNDRELANLAIEKIATDVWEEREVIAGLGPEKVKVHANGTGDLVLLKLKGAKLKPLPMRADPTTLRAMDPVMAMGYPLGTQVLEAGRADLSGTIGTVRFAEDNISHTASIFPGSSGGPLIDVDGRVLGINTWVMRSGEMTAAETFGKAIRAEHIAKLLK